MAGILFSSFALLFFSYIRHLSHRTHFLLLQFSVSSPGLSFLDTFYFMILEEKGQNPHVPAYKRMHDLAKMLYRIHIPRILAYLTEREILAGDRMMEEQQEESYPLTPIDKIANGNSLLILKALLPYLPSQKQAGAAFLVKWMEIQNIRNYYHTHPAADLTAMALPSHSVTDLFQSIAPFCRRGQREMMEQFQSMMEMMKLLETMQDFSGGENNDENPGSENLQNGSLNQNKTSWMNDSRLSGIDPAKLQMLFSMSGQGASKSQNELMPFLMAVAARSRQNGMIFTPEETNLIIEVMKQGKSKEEIARIEKIRMMMRLIK